MLAFVHQPPEIAVRADVVEAVVVDADVRQMRGHHGDGPLAAELQIPLVVRGVELQQHRAVLKALRPLGPAAGRVAAVDREHRRRASPAGSSTSIASMHSADRDQNRSSFGSRSGGVRFLSSLITSDA